ncbi:efflux RND transporter periplasmic adaptor subunit [Jiella pacifica]|uniref:Efflux RND transporter periplasmic adaptor subunit n=1 Tax=Jiella pacifica TaxID=2696469 RepID=A0A6N9T9U9_9HYPH|nr:efflux RND transporter periplasmic adaptor subunit [Jiella pacifica]NDW06836.1 efflux RND transporter periplasmic adaptor subunit [Jiella pacifica]
MSRFSVILLLSGVALVAAGAFVGIRALSRPAEVPMANEPARVPAVTVAEAAEREFVQPVTFSGTLVPREEVLIFPEINGYRITRLDAEISDRVEAGTVVAQLEDRTLHLDVAQAEAERARAEAAVRQAESQIASAEAGLAQAQQTLERAKALRERGTATQVALDDAIAAERTAEANRDSALSGKDVAEAQLRQAQNSLDIAREKLADAKIKAPVSGVISARSGRVGSIATSSVDPIFRIIRDGEVEAEVKVVETSLGLVREGQPATVEIAGLGPVEGRVRLISPQVDPKTRLGTVRIALEPQDDLRAGLFAGGRITVDQRRDLAVPATAVMTAADGAYVLRVRDGVVERRSVDPGMIWQGWRQIGSGMAAGDEVVAQAGAFFDTGDAVRPLRADEAAPLAEERSAAQAEAAR